MRGDFTTIASFETHPKLKGQGSTTSPTSYTHVNRDILAGARVEYQLQDVSYDGAVTTHSTLEILVLDAGGDNRPDIFRLDPAFPNPFNPSILQSPSAIRWISQRISA